MIGGPHEVKHIFYFLKMKAVEACLHNNADNPVKERGRCAGTVLSGVLRRWEPLGW